MYDTQHLVALQNNLSNEKERLANAKTQKEIDLRKVFVSQLEKEIAAEIKFLESKGVNLYTNTDDLSDDDIMKELGL